MGKQGKLFEDRGPDYSEEIALGGLVAGVDEAGIGPMAGPVVAAAVILEPQNCPKGINDSKKLSAPVRERLFDELSACTTFAVGEASVEEIDTLNILRASHLAMRRAVKALARTPDCCLVDGRHDPGLGITTRVLVGGDCRSLSVAAAGIIAKVTRDKIMCRLAKEFPDYWWDKNAGYCVPHHLRALELVGPSPHHRKSFSPVRIASGEESLITY